MAIAKVHAPKGFFLSEGGFEFNLSLIAISLALRLVGAEQSLWMHGEALAGKEQGGRMKGSLGKVEYAVDIIIPVIPSPCS